MRVLASHIIRKVEKSVIFAENFKKILFFDNPSFDPNHIVQVKEHDKA